ncbi:hypothetical protein VTK56DRAFT_4649 [Thermocarpiscus australiensis]
MQAANRRVLISVKTAGITALFFCPRSIILLQLDDNVCTEPPGSMQSRKPSDSENSVSGWALLVPGRLARKDRTSPLKTDLAGYDGGSTHDNVAPGPYLTWTFFHASAAASIFAPNTFRMRREWSSGAPPPCRHCGRRRLAASVDRSRPWRTTSTLRSSKKDRNIRA